MRVSTDRLPSRVRVRVRRRCRRCRRAFHLRSGFMENDTERFQSQDTNIHSCQVLSFAVMDLLNTQKRSKQRGSTNVESCAQSWPSWRESATRSPRSWRSPQNPTQKVFLQQIEVPGMSRMCFLACQHFVVLRVLHLVFTSSHVEDDVRPCVCCEDPDGFRELASFRTSLLAFI